MFFYQLGSPNKRFPLKTKLGIILGIIAALTFLAIFAFTLFLVAICGGLALFIINMFRKPEYMYKRPNAPRPKYPTRTNEDDIIDI